MKEIARAEIRPEHLLEQQLLKETGAMARYALASGYRLPAELLEPLETLVRQPETADKPQVSSREVAKLAELHAALAQIVAPAKPRTVLLLESEAHHSGLFHILGPVSLIRRMMMVAIIALIALIAISLSPEVNGDPKNFSLFENQGWSLLLNELFLLAAAAIGASFSALFLAYRYVQDLTIDPVYDGSYWIRFVLGLLSGMMLATLIPIEEFSVSPEGIHSSTLQGFGKPLLALLGGFSATLVYRILIRLLAALETLIRGDTRDLVAAREQSAKARLSEQALQQRMQLAQRLGQLQSQTGGDPSLFSRELEKIQRELLSPTAE